MSFLTAAWRELAFINYEVDPAILQPYVPYGTELDLFNGKCFVSIIAFLFMDTKVLGIKVPYHVNFPEVNLRFYVRYNDEGVWKRGAVFIKEIVPKPLITLVANTLYNENYVTYPMDYSWTQTEDARKVDYRWKVNNAWQYVTLTAALEPREIEVGSEMEFITEHYWGYAGVTKKKTNQYEVTHPRWKQYPVIDVMYDIDFKGLYGDKFAHLKEATPSSVFLIDGSAITIENKVVIT